MTARAYRSKANQDPAEWMPPAGDQHCRCVSEWIATWLRWQLSVDESELEALKVYADGPCEETIVNYSTAP